MSLPLPNHNKLWREYIIPQCKIYISFFFFQTIGVTLNISSTLLGVTLLAFGNSIGGKVLVLALICWIVLIMVKK